MSETWFDSGVTEQDAKNSEFDGYCSLASYIAFRTGAKIKLYRIDPVTGTYHYTVPTDKENSERSVLAARDMLESLKRAQENKQSELTYHRASIKRIERDLLVISTNVESTTKQLEQLEAEHSARYNNEPVLDYFEKSILDRSR